jgi:hypothetical protein
MMRDLTGLREKIGALEDKALDTSEGRAETVHAIEKMVVSLEG